MREIVHLQAGQCGNQIGAKVGVLKNVFSFIFVLNLQRKKMWRRELDAAKVLNFLLFLVLGSYLR